MYFNDKSDTNIDKDLKKNKKRKKKSKKKELTFIEILGKYKIIIFSALLLIFGIIIIIVSNRGVSYYIDLYGDNTITYYLDDEYIEPGYIAYDSDKINYTNNVQITSNLNMKAVGDYTIAYSYKTAHRERYIKVVERPEGNSYIKLLGNKTEYLKVSEKYVEPGYEVVDTVSGSSLNDKVKVENKVDSSKPGTYVLTYSVVNSSGVTIKETRTVVVYSEEISLSVDNKAYTNRNVGINVYVGDNYFDYLLLPNGTKVSNKQYTYEVSENGTYKFVTYSKNGTTKERSITLKNIDKVKPTGSCSGYYQNGVSTISVDADDNVGIEKYVIDDVSYTSSKIVVRKEYSVAYVSILDKAGNKTDITCNLTNKNSSTNNNVNNNTHSNNTSSNSNNTSSNNTNSNTHNNTNNNSNNTTNNNNTNSNNNSTNNNTNTNNNSTSNNTNNNNVNNNTTNNNSNVVVNNNTNTNNNVVVQKPGNMEIHFIASGHYDDAILIRTDKSVVLIDGGRYRCRQTVIPYLKELGITKIDLMIGSQLFRESIATQAAVLENFTVNYIYYPDDIFTCASRGTCTVDDQEYIVAALDKYHKKPIVVKSPVRSVIGDLVFYFLAPTEIVSNNGSASENAFIFVLKYYGNTFMFTGDASSRERNVTKLSESMQNIIKQYAINYNNGIDVDVLKYPHHGIPSLTDAFLSTVKPEYVIVPNYYAPKYPNADNQGMLNKYGIKTYRQSDSSTGNIVIVSDGSNIKINTGVTASQYKR